MHQEYAIEARQAEKIPYAYRTFTEKYGNYAKKYKLTMPIRRKPGEIIEVDWAGSTLKIQDRSTGETHLAYLFIAAFPYSQYCYVEAFLDMKTTSWLKAHIHAFDYFDGVAETLVPDNLKTGVTKAHRDEPILNEAYREMADYYGTIIIPSRVRAPKDKASVAGTVGYVSRQIIASLRNYQCFDLLDLNKQIHLKLDELNTFPFQKRPGSRRQVFEEEEKPYLRPLRNPRFKLAEWRVAKVQLNYHIQIERMYYSVPYDYVQEIVDIRLTKDLLEVYFNEARIASHKRLVGEVGQYATSVDHMPDNHRLHLEHTPEKNRQWAADVGKWMSHFVIYVLDTHVEKKALNLLTTVRNLSKRYSDKELEAGAEILMTITSNPTVSVLKTILSRQKNKQIAKNKNEISDQLTETNYGFLRGADYFGGKSK